MSYLMETKSKMAALAAILDEQQCTVAIESCLPVVEPNPDKKIQVDPLY
jgi:hypothetical protein